MSTYHDRFAAALRAALPEGFTVTADRALTVASFDATEGRAALIAGTPQPLDKRKPVTDADVREWIERASASTRRSLARYTDAARADARQMLDAVDMPRNLEIFFNAEANR